MVKIINLADDNAINKRAGELCFNVYQQVRDDRKQIEDRWTQFYNIWKTYVDVRYYQGQSNIYLPIVSKNIDEGIQNITGKLFPTDNFLGVTSMPGTPDNYSIAVKDMVVFQLLEEMKFPLEIKANLRDLLITGTCVGKQWFDPYERCQRFVALSILEDFYLYPTTVSCPDEAMITFERMIVDRWELERMADLGKYKNIDHLPEEGTNEGETPKQEKSVNQTLETKKKLPTYDLVESWTQLELKDGKREPVCITFDPTKKIIIQVTPSPLKYKTPSGEKFSFTPYSGMALTRNPKSFYGGHSTPEMAQRLQYATNDCANLVLDNGILIQNPIVKMDTARVNNPASCVFKPRAKWECEPDAVVFDRPPDVLQSGLKLLGQLKFWTEENSNIGGMNPMSTKRTTATEIDTFARMLGQFISSTVVDIEYGFTTPIAKKTFWLDQIYLKPADIRRILGVNGNYIQLGNKGGAIIKKDYMFRWLGSTQSMNIYIKGQQTINLIGVASSIPPQVMGNKRIDFGRMLEIAWSSLGYNGNENVIIDDGENIEIDPQEENEIMANGKEVKVNPRDNGIHHIMTHNAGSQNITDEAILNIFIKHTRNHIAQEKAKFELAQQMSNPMLGGGQGTIPPPSGGQNPPANMPLPPTNQQANDFGSVAAANLGGANQAPGR